MRLPVLTDQRPNSIAADLTGRDYISYSQLKLFQTCPLRWYFEYVEGLPPEVVGSSLVFGGAIHAAIEHFYRAQMAGDPPPASADLLASFDAAWSADAVAPIAYGDADAAALRGLAENMLTAFLESDLSEPGGEVIGIEEELHSPIALGLPDLLARVDLMVATDDALVIRDFKTARSRWGATQRADSAGQLLLYGELARPLADALGLTVRLEFLVVTKTKSPVIERHPVKSDSDRMARMRLALQRIWSAMQAGHIYPNPSRLNCATCPHQTACRDWRG